MQLVFGSPSQDIEIVSVSSLSAVLLQVRATLLSAVCQARFQQSLSNARVVVKLAVATESSRYETSGSLTSLKNYAETESAEEAKSDQVEALKRGQPKIELYYLILYVM